MRVLVVNAGSSSLKLRVLRDDGENAGRWEVEQTVDVDRCAGEHDLTELEPAVAEAGAIDAVGHRVVHGGAEFSESTRLTAEVMEEGGGFAIQAADVGADPDERELLAQWGFTAVTAAAAIAPDGSAWLVELYSDPRTHALPAALPELRLLAGEAVGRMPGGGYAPSPVTSEAKSSKTST